MQRKERLMTSDSTAGRDDDLNKLVRDLTTVHPLPKSQVRALVKAFVERERVSARIGGEVEAKLKSLAQLQPKPEKHE